MDENNLTPQKEDISEKYNEIFQYNTSDFAEAEMMNRDYLHHIYGEGMESLNKAVLLTRTQHLKRVEETEKNYEKELNWSKKMLVASSIILGVCIVSALSFYAQGLRYYDLFAENIIDVGTSAGYEVDELRATWQIFGLSGMAGSIFLLVGGLQFYMLGYGSIKRMKKLKKSREKALQTLEDIKKENMLLGTYDASQ